MGILKALTDEFLVGASSKYHSTKEFMIGEGFPVSHARYSKIVNDRLSEMSLVWLSRVIYTTVTCQTCERDFTTRVSKRDTRKTCSDACAKELTARSNRKPKILKIEGKVVFVQKTTCLNCGSEITSKKFCKGSCQHEYRRKEYIGLWKCGKVTGNNNSKVCSISKYVRGYILSKYNYSCHKCGWDTVHPVDGLPLVEINHINGDASDSSEGNLELLCPNCHAMTYNFRARNKVSSRKRN